MREFEGVEGEPVDICLQVDGVLDLALTVPVGTHIYSALGTWCSKKCFHRNKHEFYKTELPSHSHMRNEHF